MLQGQWVVRVCNIAHKVARCGVPKHVSGETKGGGQGSGLVGGGRGVLSRHPHSRYGFWAVAVNSWRLLPISFHSLLCSAVQRCFTCVACSVSCRRLPCREA